MLVYGSRTYLRFLDDLAIGPHALLGVGLGEGIGNKRRLVQAGERNELPTVAERGEALDVGFLLVARHGRFPVEGGREVVGKPVGCLLAKLDWGEVVRGGKKGKILYFCSGHAACTPSANSFACA